MHRAHIVSGLILGRVIINNAVACHPPPTTASRGRRKSSAKKIGALKAWKRAGSVAVALAAGTFRRGKSFEAAEQFLFRHPVHVGLIDFWLVIDDRHVSRLLDKRHFALLGL